MEQMNQAYKVFTRICLNNWHYIDRKVLGLNESINFFTGHSGSGKSTVIDAMQIVLYANTDGRGFFNKAAADDSDRSLIEYLRGMINIGENNQAEYKRNKNFSTTIVLEMEQTITKEKECIGVVFDVETATNEINRLFFWHKGELIPGDYRTKSRAMTISEVRSYLQQNFPKDEMFYTSNNERFRRNLYDVYLGGLDMEKFPRLFKRAIPFKMNIRLEDFVKEYICMEQDIHIEDMQEGAMLYGRMCRKIEATMQEIEELKQISAQYQAMEEKKKELLNCHYRMDKLTILQLEQTIEEMQHRVENWKKDVVLQNESLAELLEIKGNYEKEYSEINEQIAGTGYARLEEQLKSLEENLSLLERSKNKWDGICARLNGWEDVDIVSNQILWDIEKFKEGTITGEEIERLKRSLIEVQKEAEKDRQEASAEIRSMNKEADVLEKELAELKLGKKAYPRELELARSEIARKLSEQTGKNIQVRIFADLIDIKDETWRSAIEGYLSWNKLALIVEPAYVKQAMEVYETLDEKRFFRVSLVDTEKLMQEEWRIKDNALAEEVEAKEPYVRAFVDFLLGNVIKCASVDELRQCKIGVTADCLLYQSYQLRRLNPDNYKKHVYIGEKSKKQRQKELAASLEKLEQDRAEYKGRETEARNILAQEFLNDTVEEYQNLILDLSEKKEKEKQKIKTEKKMAEIGAGTVETLKKQAEEIHTKQKELEAKIDDLKYQIRKKEDAIEKDGNDFITRNEELLAKKRELRGSIEAEETFEAYIAGQKNKKYDSMKAATQEDINQAAVQCTEQKNKLVDVRMNYLQNHPKRDFSASAENNDDYDNLLSELSCNELEEYQKKAAEQAKAAVEHFKEDFVYKIRSAIKEAYVRRDELNRIIRNLNFGKDRYQFKITRNKGADGAFYDMFMDEDLEIDPSSLASPVEHQMNLFSMEHENKYGMLMSELIRIFIPPENATQQELDEAKQNMVKYADYRTYLSFEMEQIVEGDERLVIGLSKMIKKNSGGEGQNPLYIALLASFAQAYHINLSARLTRRPTIRLVVLDEAFSKMDAEKVASCIELIRGLGFQAIISATNDKIQNYIENVDKTFVYANPNKKSISIQEFEKKDFSQLVVEEE